MHEYPITQSIINIALEEAERNKAKKINEIRIKVGELSGCVPECIQHYFDIMSKGSIVEGAILKIEKLPIKLKCSDCGFEVPIKQVEENKCPSCLSNNTKMAGGNEFYIDSMEVED